MRPSIFAAVVEGDDSDACAGGGLGLHAVPRASATPLPGWVCGGGASAGVRWWRAWRCSEHVGEVVVSLRD